MNLNDLQIIYSIAQEKTAEKGNPILFCHTLLSSFLFLSLADKLGRHKMPVNAFLCISTAASKKDSNIKGEDKGLI